MAGFEGPFRTSEGARPYLFEAEAGAQGCGLLPLVSEGHRRPLHPIGPLSPRAGVQGCGLWPLVSDGHRRAATFYADR